MYELETQKIEKIIHYHFKNENLLKKAFTHSSYANEFDLESNQRLEFLGDSILSFIVAEKLYLETTEEEGRMSKWRAKLVSSDNLANIIKNLKLDKLLLLGRSFSHLDVSKSVREDLFECIVGAIYLDGGIDKARKFVEKFINLDDDFKKKEVDFKTALQEVVQQYKGANLVYFTYELPREQGVFCSEIYINDIFVVRCTGQSKKQSQIEGARLALENIGKLKEILEK